MLFESIVVDVVYVVDVADVSTALWGVQLLRDVHLGQLMDMSASEAAVELSSPRVADAVGEDGGHGGVSVTSAAYNGGGSVGGTLGGAVLDVHRNWSETLSGGEQQRVGFARLLYHAPRFALLDESTSAMDVALERHVMEVCRSRGITCVSVGHRPTLKAFHEVHLYLDGSGGCRLEKNPLVGGSSYA